MWQKLTVIVVGSLVASPRPLRTRSPCFGAPDRTDGPKGLLGWPLFQGL
jgi:hypothetical protein